MRAAALIQPCTADITAHRHPPPHPPHPPHYPHHPPHPPGFMMSTAPAVCLFILACVLACGDGRIIRPYYPPLKTSSVSVTENMCSDCAKIIELFSDMLSQPTAQDLIQETFLDVCRHLPHGQVTKDCMDFVQNHLPTVLQRFIAFTAFREGEICLVLGLCAVQPENKAPELLNVGMQEVQPFRGTAPELQLSPQCTFCLFFIKKLESMLPKERTEETVVKLLEKICDHLPEHYKEQCNNILENYGKQIIDFLLTSATPHTICMFLHLCLVQDMPALEPVLPSDCKTCKVLMILTQAHLGQNATETQMTSLLWKMCHVHPNALPGCEPLIYSHAPKLVNILSKKEEAVNACQRFFCAGNE